MSSFWKYFLQKNKLDGWYDIENKNSVLLTNFEYKRFASQVGIENVLSDEGYAGVNKIGIQMGNNQLVAAGAKKWIQALILKLTVFTIYAIALM